MGRGRPITNRSINLNPEAYDVLTDAAQVAARRYRGQDVGDYVSVGWLTTIQQLPEDQPIPSRSLLFGSLLQNMRKHWAIEWNKHKNEVPLVDELEHLQEGETEEPLASMMANEYMAMLKPVDRRLVRMRLWQQMEWRDIGAAFGITAQAAQMRYVKIIAGLREKVIS